MKHRLLPGAAYDFFVRDNRDGEESKYFDTLAEARAVAQVWKRRLAREDRCVIQVCWYLNERKILALLRGAR